MKSTRDVNSVEGNFYRGSISQSTYSVHGERWKQLNEKMNEDLDLWIAKRMKRKLSYTSKNQQVIPIADFVNPFIYSQHYIRLCQLEDFKENEIPYDNMHELGPKIAAPVLQQSFKPFPYIGEYWPGYLEDLAKMKMIKSQLQYFGCAYIGLYGFCFNNDRDAIREPKTWSKIQRLLVHPDPIANVIAAQVAMVYSNYTGFWFVDKSGDIFFYIVCGFICGRGYLTVNYYLLLERFFNIPEYRKRFRDAGGIPFLAYLLKRYVKYGKIFHIFVYHINRLIYLLCLSSKIRYEFARHGVANIQLRLILQLHRFYLIPSIGITSMFCHEGLVQLRIDMKTYVRKMFDLIRKSRNQIMINAAYSLLTELLKHKEGQTIFCSMKKEFLDHVKTLKDTPTLDRLLVLRLWLVYYMDEFNEKIAHLIFQMLKRLRGRLLGELLEVISKIVDNREYGDTLFKMGLVDQIWPFMFHVNTFMLPSLLKLFGVLVKYPYMRNGINNVQYFYALWSHVKYGHKTVITGAVTTVTAFLKTMPRMNKILAYVPSWLSSVTRLIEIGSDPAISSLCEFVVVLSRKRRFKTVLSHSRIAARLIPFLGTCDKKARDMIILVLHVFMRELYTHNALIQSNLMDHYLDGLKSERRKVQKAVAFGFYIMCTNLFFRNLYFIKYLEEHLNPESTKANLHMARSICWCIARSRNYKRPINSTARNYKKSFGRFCKSLMRIGNDEQLLHIRDYGLDQPSVAVRE